MLIHYVIPFGAPFAVLAAALALVNGQARPSSRVLLGLMLAGSVVGFALAVLLAGGTFERLLS